MKKLKKIALCLGAFLFVACANVPKLDKVEKIEKISDITNITSQKSIDDYSLTFNSQKWWLNLNDSSLNELINLVLENNKTLKIAKLNIQKSEEAINLSKSARGVDVGLSTGLTRIETRENPLKKFTGKDSYTLYNIGLQTSYELDLFNKFGNNIKESKYRKIAVEANSKLVELTLEYQTAKLYAYWLYLNEENRNLLERKQVLENILAMEKIGVGIGKETEDNVLVVREMLAGINILINKNEENKNLTKNNFYLLIGASSSEKIDNILGKASSKSFEALSSNINIPKSVESDIIANRPNVQYYLALMNAQEAKVKSLKINFYPSFHITGMLSYGSLKISDLISPKNLLGIISPSIKLPILESGKIKSSYKIAGIDYNIFVEQYNEELLKSIKDINDKFINYNSALAISQESNNVLNIRKEQFARSQKKLELGMETEKTYMTNKYNYLAEKLDDSQRNLSLLNTKLDFINATGGIYGKSN